MTNTVHSARSTSDEVNRRPAPRAESRRASGTSRICEEPAEHARDDLGIAIEAQHRATGLGQGHSQWQADIPQADHADHRVPPRLMSSGHPSPVMLSKREVTPVRDRQRLPLLDNSLCEGSGSRHRRYLPAERAFLGSSEWHARCSPWRWPTRRRCWPPSVGQRAGCVTFPLGTGRQERAGTVTSMCPRIGEVRRKDPFPPWRSGDAHRSTGVCPHRRRAP